MAFNAPMTEPIPNIAAEALHTRVKQSKSEADTLGGSSRSPLISLLALSSSQLLYNSARVGTIDFSLPNLPRAFPILSLSFFLSLQVNTPSLSARLLLQHTHTLSLSLSPRAPLKVPFLSPYKTKRKEWSPKAPLFSRILYLGFR